MSAIGKRLGLGALVALTLGLGSIPAGATTSFEIVRRSGEDRYKTAQVLANEGFPGGAAAAIVVRGDGGTVNFADALASSYLAGGLGDGVPILLTDREELPEVTKAALEGLGVSAVQVLGGPNAVSEAVYDELDADYEVARIEGIDRFQTAALAATALDADAIGTVDGKRTAFLANGRTGLVDALAAGPLAYAQRLPVLLTESGSLPDASEQAIESLGIDHVVVVGGTTVVNASVVTAVEGTGVTVERIGGTNRYETATDLADFAGDEFSDWSDTAVDVASGVSIADALAGGPVSGRAARSLLLANTGLPTHTASWLADNAATLESARAFGGTAVLPQSVLDAITAAARGGGVTATGTVVSVNPATDTYRYVATDADEATSVTYRSGDTFTVDGQAATIGGFEAALSAADTITHTTAKGSTPAKHQLTNVEPATITEGTVGNVDLGEQEFDFVHPVTGDALRQDIGYGAATATYTVDGAAQGDATTFEADINEGDTLVLTSTGSGVRFDLTNVELTGIVTEVSTSSVPPATRYKIGGLGDVAESGTAGDDSHYVADGGLTSTDVYTVDGAEADYATFSGEISVGDRVTYSRSGEVETMVLVNLAPVPTTGTAVDDLDADGDPSPLAEDHEDGGSFTLATESGETEVTYGPTGTFVVNGMVATEGEFEGAYSAGDRITYRAADTPSGTTQRLELVSGDLSGEVDPESVNTTGQATLANPSRPADSYAVLAANGTTELATVLYADGGDDGERYVVNGVTATLEQFEEQLIAIASGTKTGTVVVQEAADVQTHRLTTTDVPAAQ